MGPPPGRPMKVMRGSWLTSSFPGDGGASCGHPEGHRKPRYPEGSAFQIQQSHGHVACEMLADKAQGGLLSP